MPSRRIVTISSRRRSWAAFAATGATPAAGRAGVVAHAVPWSQFAPAAGSPAGCASSWRGVTLRRGHRREHLPDHVVGGDALGERVVGEDQPVAQDLGRDVEDVLGHEEAPAPQHGERPAGRDHAERGARAHAERDVLRRAAADPTPPGHASPSRGGPRSRAPRGGRTPRRPAPCSASSCSTESTCVGLGRRHAHAARDLGLLDVRRLLDDDLHQEAVALRLGQRVDALGLDRVLRREHEERVRQRLRSGRRSTPDARP